MKIAFAVFLFAVGIACISAQTFGNVTGRPVHGRVVRADAVPNQVQIRWVQFSGVNEWFSEALTK